MSWKLPVGWENAEIVHEPSPAPPGWMNTWKDTFHGDPVLLTGTGRYAWEQQDQLMQQSACSASGSFSASLSFEEGTSTTYSIGGLLNIAGERAEVSGSYSYSVSQSHGTGSSQTIEFGERGYEYLMIPVVLTFRLTRWASFPEGAPVRVWLVDWFQHLCAEVEKVKTGRLVTIEDNVITCTYPKLGTTLSMLVLRRKCTKGGKSPDRGPESEKKKGPRGPKPK